MKNWRNRLADILDRCGIPVWNYYTRYEIHIGRIRICWKQIHDDEEYY